VQVFGYSPDETAYCRLVLYRVNTPDAMVRPPLQRLPAGAVRRSRTPASS
jgi:hypothetical protein